MRRHVERILFLLFLTLTAHAQTPRTTIPLLNNWRTAADDHNQQAYPSFERSDFNDQTWQTVAVPHNWDAYEGYRRQRHGNRHGYAWYRKIFPTPAAKSHSRYFLFFEGVGSYATVWLNDQKVGYHAGGRTTFTLDVTNALKPAGQPNVLAVRADHPANIQDLPWVCGGCSEERGFSEGSQPMGIFRPVALVVTNPVRVEPFGVHIWADSSVSAQAAKLNVDTEVKNYGAAAQTLTITSQLVDRQGRSVAESRTKQKLAAGAAMQLHQQLPVLKQPHLWSLADPYLYRLVTRIRAKGKLIDELETPYGIRWVSWPIGRAAASQKQFLLNGKPVFINGIAEYEHLLGQSHAFSDTQIRTRVQLVKAAGFNAFRDAHQPHNLRYQANWDSLGLLWWPQLAAHVWYDTPSFRQNFKTLLIDWVKERRNSPSVVLWGLENESTLPADFARECSALIRQLDPTASRERKITTCNGGQGTDWDVPQNWTGTYGGDPATYAADVQRQVLIGEYGAWRTLDLHTEGPPVLNGGPFSEDRFAQLMEQKVRLAETAKDQTAGHFFWLLTSHDNPGRVQGGEGQRELDRIGPVNYKGLLTPWEEPTDAFYMFRANYAPKDREPMVYLASHTWPDRWLTPGRKDSITVYSNCDEVELFNDVNAASLGRKARTGGIGTHFQWDGVDIKYNVLYAVGYVAGRAVAKDYIVLHHLPKAPNFDKFLADAQPITQPQPGLNYLYRVNCGGPAYQDQHGSTWQADQPRTDSKTWGSESWTQDFPGLSPFFASQRRTHDPIAGTRDWPLFQSFRYGREKLRYTFPVPDGEYLVELYFAEPWLGTGGSMDCTSWRVFDVAINGETVLKNLDIWKEVGHDVALKKTVKARVTGGQLVISFPSIASGQALISAIAIASTEAGARPAPASLPVISSLWGNDATSASPWSAQTWLDTGVPAYASSQMSFSSLPPVLFGAEWLRGPAHVGKRAGFTVSTAADVYIALDARQTTRPTWLMEYEDTKTTLTTADAAGAHFFRVFRRRFPAGAAVSLGPDGAGSNILPYLVAANRASTIEPAYDLKAIMRYKPATARLSGPGLVREQVNAKESLTFKEPNGSALEWTIQVGVADTYSLTFRYANPLPKTLTAKLTVSLADGTVLKAENVELVPSKPGKWNYLATSTGSMINAGSYRVKLTATDAAGLSVSGLDVQ
ncbi:malectin domain-containing carbohydrate-binding protein [Hymenobacter rubidus]|uniref:malectin domain-containing carbohydrate-binding protein n=1 Tax=Hymenobacter rubidus TaxID=1441626 RepID=UPI00191F3F96|nr:malectin domain-containing carbohydrate-binding protein [Hymenobacter rubidus]